MHTTHYAVLHDPQRVRPAIPFARFISGYNFAKRTDGQCLEVYGLDGRFFDADGVEVPVKGGVK